MRKRHGGDSTNRSTTSSASFCFVTIRYAEFEMPLISGFFPQESASIITKAETIHDVLRRSRMNLVGRLNNNVGVIINIT